MKTIRLSARGSRIAAIGLLVLAVLLAYFVLLHLWFMAPLREIDAQMDDLRDTQSRYAAAIAEQPQLLQRLAASGAGGTDSRAFLPEDDPGSAAAGLMQRVVDAVAAQHAGGSCAVTQKMPVTDVPTRANDPYRAVAVNITLRCDIQPLVGVLQTLEQGTPILLVDNISIYRNPAVGQAGGEPSLDVQFALSGYVRPAGMAVPAAPATTPAGDAPLPVVRMPGGAP